MLSRLVVESQVLRCLPLGSRYKLRRIVVYTGRLVFQGQNASSLRPMLSGMQSHWSSSRKSSIHHPDAADAGAS